MARVGLLLFAGLLTIAHSSVQAQCAKPIRRLPDASTAKPADFMAKWESLDYSKQVLRDADLSAMKSERLALIRGIIFGRHGRIFKELSIQSYLYGRPWYHASESFTNAMLSDTERANLDKVRLAEAAKHKFIQPGDMRLWSIRPFAVSKVKTAKLLDLHIMRSEVEAIHGKVFTSEPSLQTYFEERYWYKSDPHYNTRALSKVERANIATLSKIEATRGHSGIRPDDVLAYQDHLIPRGALARMSLQDLRLLRNGFYAAHGREFRSDWMQGFLDAQEWYKPIAYPTPLTGTEKKNVLMVVKRETELHEGLGKSPVSGREVGGLGLEDVRNLKDEIYARHGRVFKTKWLESYFASQAWYKANPKYSDTLLNRVEKRNIHYLAQVQKKLESEMSHEEG